MTYTVDDYGVRADCVKNAILSLNHLMYFDADGLGFWSQTVPQRIDAQRFDVHQNPVTPTTRRIG